jgi:hypothetical protein
MLKGRLARRGFDWWWHSLVATDAETGERKPFFIEYYAVNPGLATEEPRLGQSDEAKKAGARPCYAMIKAGTWGADAAQLHGFYPVSAFRASRNGLDASIGDNVVDEERLIGSVTVAPEQAARKEYMCDSGSMSWDLRAEKTIAYSVGYGASRFMRAIGAFSMYWHVGGMRTRYSGTIVWNGRRYLVDPTTSCGYQDKNWGRDFTDEWVWLNCNDFVREGTGEKADASLDVGGAKPVAFGLKMPRNLLVAFYLDGKMYEFNFSKFWTKPKVGFECGTEGDFVTWSIDAVRGEDKLELRFRCSKKGMLKVNYENPDGMRFHRELWNGGFASGTARLYSRDGGGWRLVEALEGKFGGCEYGRATR